MVKESKRKPSLYEYIEHKRKVEEEIMDKCFDKTQAEFLKKYAHLIPKKKFKWE